MPAYLDAILASHRASAAADGRELGSTVDRAAAVLAEASAAGGAGAPRDFTAALRAGRMARGMAVISEVKRRSPSKGDLDPDLDPAVVAADYETGGASCLSVLTDQAYFGGCPADLVAARAACSLPTLRKDFTVSPFDICDARIMGADAVLLIVAALDDLELSDLLALARRLELAALVEVHDDEELDRALGVGADLIGVNQRDLKTFEVDRARALRMGARLPGHVVAVAESGIRDARDVAELTDAGYSAVLVGETLVRAADRTSAVDSLLGART